MYIYVCMCGYEYVFIWMHMYINVWVCEHTYVKVCVCVCIWVSVWEQGKGICVGILEREWPTVSSMFEEPGLLHQTPPLWGPWGFTPLQTDIHRKFEGITCLITRGSPVSSSGQHLEMNLTAFTFPLNLKGSFNSWFGAELSSQHWDWFSGAFHPLPILQALSQWAVALS